MHYVSAFVCLHFGIYIYIYPSVEGMKQDQFLSGVFFFKTGCHIKLNQPYYLPIAGGRIVGCISFPKILAQCVMQMALSRI